MRNSSAVLLAVCLLTAVGAADSSQPLVRAAQSGNRPAVQLLLQARADVNAADPDGMTALHWATRIDDVEMVTLLLRAGARVGVANRLGITPLWLAAQNGSSGAVDALLRAGADPNAALPGGRSVLMAAARTGKADVLRLLLARGADVNVVEGTLGHTALMWAAAENHGGAIEVLARAGAAPDARSAELTFPPFSWAVTGMVSTSLPRGGWSALMYAARENAMDAARALADAGADLNLTDPDGTTALVVAIVNAHFDLAALLLEKGADPNVADATGMTPLYAAVDMHTLAPMLSRPAPRLTSGLDALGIARALLARGANPNAALKRPIFGRHHDAGDASLSEGTTPLMRAAKAADVPMMRLLLDAGADPTLTQRDYTNAVIIAALGGARTGAYAPPATQNDAIEAIRLCLDSGADVNAFNVNGQTALHAAAGRGADAVIRFLSQRGAKVTFKDKQGRTPLDVAQGGGGRGRGGGGAAGGREKTVALLRELMSVRTVPAAARP